MAGADVVLQQLRVAEVAQQTNPGKRVHRRARTGEELAAGLVQVAVSNSLQTVGQPVRGAEGVKMEEGKIGVRAPLDVREALGPANHRRRPRKLRYHNGLRRSWTHRCGY